MTTIKKLDKEHNHGEFIHEQGLREILEDMLKQLKEENKK